MSESDKHHKTTYFVNSERETTDEKQLLVKTILEHAGFTPAVDYTLKSENPPKDFDSHYEEVIEIHENERFLALFKGPTPTS